MLQKVGRFPDPHVFQGLCKADRAILADQPGEIILLKMEDVRQFFDSDVCQMVFHVIEHLLVQPLFVQLLLIGGQLLVDLRRQRIDHPGDQAFDHIFISALMILHLPDQVEEQLFDLFLAVMAPKTQAAAFALRIVQRVADEARQIRVGAAFQLAEEQFIEEGF